MMPVPMAPRKPPESPPPLTVLEEAERTALLAALVSNGWNLTHTAAALRLRGPQEVRRAIVRLRCEVEYQTARDAGLVAPGGRPPKQ